MTIYNLTVVPAGQTLINQAIANNTVLPYAFYSAAGRLTQAQAIAAFEGQTNGPIPTLSASVDKKNTSFIIYHSVPSEIDFTAVIKSGNTVIGFAIVTNVAGSPYNPSVSQLVLRNVAPRVWDAGFLTAPTDIISREAMVGKRNEFLLEKERRMPVLFEGQTLFSAGPNANPKQGPILIETNVATTAAELAAAQANSVSMADVFNTWTRFSHRAAQFPSNEALPSELQAWTYDVNTDTIKCLLNTETFVGFISPKNYLNFDLDLQVSSTDGDDDYIGVVVAANYTDGQLRTLTLGRSPGGSGKWQLHYSFMYNDTVQIANPHATLMWGNGVAGATAAEAGYVSNTAGHGWAGWPAGTRIRVERRGDIIRAWTSDLGQTALKEETLITLDLASSSRYQVFRGGSRYGYCASSQKDSSYKVNNFIDYDDVIVDSVNNRILERSSSGWVVASGKTPSTVIPKGRFAFSNINKKLMYRDEQGTLIVLN